MGKKKVRIEENLLVLPALEPAATALPLTDTHTHLISTFASYKQKYSESARFETLFDFARNLYAQGSNPVKTIVDVYCEAPVISAWKELADASEAEWGGLDYKFVMGVHPHNAKDYNDGVESDILEAMEHPRCVGWGEIGLDYHYDLSPRDIQQEIFARQLRLAVRLKKPMTIHTREAEVDTERLLKEIVPRDWKIHVHCFTDTPTFAKRLLDHFRNLFIGVTGVITYSTNRNTVALVRDLAASGNLRILLETDAPYMVPNNLYASLPKTAKGRLPLCHSGMIPWTAQFIAEAIGWETTKVIYTAEANARTVYDL